MAKKEAKKIVKIACEGAATLPLEDLEEFQGELKTLSEENAARLRRVILRDGFSEPFSIWRNEGHNYILNGHQRFHVLHMLVDDGYTVGPLPVSWVEADSFKQAKIKILDLTSQYGEVTAAGLQDFIVDLDLNSEEIDLSFHFPDLGTAPFAYGENDPDGEWKGMPEFEQEDKLGFQRIAVHFNDQQGVDQFAELIGQKLTPKTRAIWFPEAEQDCTTDIRYESES